jgi:hypothetical protein
VHFPGAFQGHFNIAFPSALSLVSYYCFTATASCPLPRFSSKSSWFEEFEFYDNDKDEQFQQVQSKCGPTVNLRVKPRAHCTHTCLGVVEP